MTIPHVAVYITSHDTATTRTIAALEAAHVPYLLVDATDPATATQLWHEGWRDWPVITAGRDAWAGYQPEHLADLTSTAGPTGQR